MPVYVDVLMLLNFLVDFLLLIGTSRLSGYPPDVKRGLAAAMLGGIYGGCCVIPEVRFLSNLFWRIVFLALMAVIAFGLDRDALRRGVLFLFLSMALGGIASGLGSAGIMKLMISAIAVCILCLVGFRGRAGAEYLPVVLEGHRLTALRDTGNTLTDPLTGQRVLVVSATVAEKVLRLSPEELADPVAAVTKVSGGRLLPYQAVGKQSLLVAKRFNNVQIGKWCGSCLVAFAPNEIGGGNSYEALTGGVA